MQEIHSTGGGRFFGGGGGAGGGAGDRRLRPSHHHQNHQPLNCPRCDSLNTKFCYYNNYNLSQPRHFCKNCRRYWTKGGVLRNVPIGGGCRKSKRSNKQKKSSSTTASETLAAPAPTSQPPLEPERKSSNSQHSSSESSSITATITTAAATEAVSAPTPNSDSNHNMQESMMLISSNPETLTLEQSGATEYGIFSEIGSFTSLITSTNEALGFGFGNNIPGSSPFQLQQQKLLSINADNHHYQDLKLPEITAGSVLDQTVPVDLSALQNKTVHGGFGSLDWHTGVDQGLFDLSDTVDQAYWSHSHWSDQDNSTLFPLP